jgi:hypothetical protein
MSDWLNRYMRRKARVQGSTFQVQSSPRPPRLRVNIKLRNEPTSLGSQISGFQISDCPGTAVPDRRYSVFTKRTHFPIRVPGVYPWFTRRICETKPRTIAKAISTTRSAVLRNEAIRGG